MISEKELSPMRDFAVGLMNKVASIERFTSEDDGSLGTIDTWKTINEGVRCRIAEVRGSQNREVIQAGRITSTGDHVVHFPYGTDIHESDRIRVKVSTEERLFEVSRLVEHSFATTTTVLCSESR